MLPYVSATRTSRVSGGIRYRVASILRRIYPHQEAVAVKEDHPGPEGHDLHQRPGEGLGTHVLFIRVIRVGKEGVPSECEHCGKGQGAGPPFSWFCSLYIKYNFMCSSKCP